MHEEFPARCKVILKLNVDFKARNLTGMRRRVTFLPVMLDGTWRASENKSRNNGTFHKACLWLISRKGQRLCQAVCWWICTCPRWWQTDFHGVLLGDLQMLCQRVNLGFYPFNVSHIETLSFLILVIWEFLFIFRTAASPFFSSLVLELKEFRHTKKCNPWRYIHNTTGLNTAQNPQIRRWIVAIPLRMRNNRQSEYAVSQVHCTMSYEICYTIRATQIFIFLEFYALAIIRAK